MNLKLDSWIYKTPTPRRAYQPILVEGFDHIYQNIIYFVDDREAVIVYAITIAEKNSKFHYVNYYQKGTRRMAKNHLYCLCSVLMAFIVLAGCIKVDPASESLEITLDVDGAGSNQPVIDGVLNSGEWDRADLVHFEDGSELFLLQSGEYLYLAVRALPAEMIAGNVFINEGDLISILHTSAALGTAVYEREGSTWRKIQDFEWCCRTRLDGDEARANREVFFDKEGWLGINSFLGNENELEYKIRLTGSEEFLAVNLLRVDNPAQKQVWPIDLVDGPAQPSEKGFPEVMEFSPENWQILEELP